MWVCLCNELVTEEIQEAINNGCKTPEEVHEYCNSIPQCCNCFISIIEVIKEKEGLDDAEQHKKKKD